MGIRYYESEESVAGRLRAREASEVYRSTVVPSELLSNRIAAFTQAYPRMPAGQVLGLASSTLDPSDPGVQKMYEASVEQQRQKGDFDLIGGIMGSIKGAIATVASPVARAIDTGLGEFDEEIVPVLKGGLRAAAVVLESGAQELQTFIRAGGYAGVDVKTRMGGGALRNMMPDRWDDQFESWRENYSDAGSSSAREAIGAMLRGEDVELGSGFMPDYKGAIETRVRERANRLAMTVNNVQFGGAGNLSITPGRVIAGKVAEPGDTAFNVVSGMLDAGVAWFGDPSSAIGGVWKAQRVGNRLNRAQRAATSGGALRELSHSGLLAGVAGDALGGGAKALDRSLQSRAAESLAGLIPGYGGTRNSVMTDVTEAFFAKQGRHLIEKFAESDFTTIQAATGGKMPVKVMRALADADTTSKVMDVIRSEAGAGLRESPEFLGFKVTRDNRRGVRLLQGMPGAFVDPNDLDGMVNQTDRMMRNLGVPAKMRQEAVEKVARIENTTEVQSTFTRILSDAAEEMVERQGRKSIRVRGDDRKALKGIDDDALKAREKAKAVKERVRNLLTMRTDEIEEQKAYFLHEIAEDRKLRGVVIGGDAADVPSPHVMTEYLNTLVPLPDAREIRRATSELGRLVDNPFFENTVDALDWVQGKWKQTALMRGAYTIRVIGEEQLRMSASGLDSMFNHPISYISSLLADPEEARRIIGGAKLGTGKTRQTGVVGEFYGDMHDEMRSVIIKGQTKWADETLYDRNYTMFGKSHPGYSRAWANGVGELSRNPLEREVAKAKGNLDDVKEWFYNGKGRNERKKFLVRKPELKDRAASDAHVEMSWEIVNNHTGGDMALLDAVATGMFGGKRIGTQDDKGKWAFDQGFMAHFDDVTNGPVEVKGQKALMSKEKRSVWDKATGVFFNNFMTKPTNYLSRGPASRQLYWNRIEEMLPHMEDGVRAKALALADGVVDKAQMQRMQKAPSFAKKVDAGTEVLVPTTRDVEMVSDRRLFIASGPADGVGPAAEGLPPLFHGTSKPIEGGKPVRWAGRSAESLYGPGFYTTDAPEIAGKYTRKGRGAEPTTYGVKFTGGTPRVLDAEAAMPGDVAAVAGRWVDDYLESADIPIEDLAELRRMVEEGGSLETFYANARDALAYGERQTAEVSELVDILNDNLSEAYDAIKHTGGKLTGGQPHNVFVWLDPEKLDIIKRAPGTEIGKFQETVKGQVPSLGTAVPAARHSDPHARDLGDWDTLAKQYAIDGTKKLLYDASEKGQFFDAFRLVFPFGEAWKEVTTRWAKIGLENPRSIRRAQQTIQGARGNGFFSKDDKTGEEMYSWAPARWAGERLLGMPINITSRVSGLSLMTEVLPGVGPLMQASAAAFLPDGSEYNWVREVVSPFGEPDYSGGVIEALLPGFVKKISGVANAQQRNTAITMAWDYLDSTGEYGPDPESQDRMFNDAKQIGTNAHVLLGFAQFFAPSAPRLETYVKGLDEDGKDDLYLRSSVLADFRKMQEDHKSEGYDGYGAAIEEFVHTYGVDMLKVSEPMSQTLRKSLPVSQEAGDWVRDNSDIVGDFRKTWGFFAPQGGEFDMTEYGRQVDVGDRKRLTTRERAERASQSVGRYIYAQQEKLVGDRPTKQQREWLKAVKEKIAERYPGYGSMSSGLGFGDDLDKQVIPELERAVLDPRLASTPQAQAIRAYLTARAQALAFTEEEYGTGLGSMAAEDVRFQLMQIGQNLARKYPTFAPLFDKTFRYELED